VVVSRKEVLFSRDRICLAKRIAKSLSGIQVVLRRRIWYNLVIEIEEHCSRTERRMNKKKLNKRNIHDPAVVQAVLEDIRTMPIEELDAFFRRYDDIEYQDMNGKMAEYDREQKRKAAAERAA
jgi:chromosomal replication initiation ATPase DnaA